MARQQVNEATFAKASVVTIPSLDGYLKPVTVYGKSTQASTPTPDVPVAITSTTGNVTVRSDSKNLIISDRNSYTANGLTITQNGNGSFTVNGTATAETYVHFNSTGARYIKIESGRTYTISNDTLGSVSTYSVDFNVLFDDATNLVYSSRTAPTFTANKSGITNAYLTVRSGYVATNLVVRPQLEVGSTATAFEKNTTSTQTLPLGTTQLRSLPNGVSDRIYKSGGSWFLEQNVDYRVLNGSEAWGDQSLESGYFRGLLNTSGLPFKSRIGMNDRFTERANTAHGAYEYKFSQDTLNGPIYIQVLDTRLSAHTTAAFKTWLAANPVTSLSDLATPITTPITDPTLITALENIRTYQGVTNITASTPVSGVYLPNSLRTAATNRLTAVGRQIATNRVKVN